MKFADLHLHTRYSDGSYTPEELAREAARQEFAAIAVTDHDTLDAIPESLLAGQEFGVEVIAGVEITCRVETQEVHLLGYLFDDTWKNASLHAVLDHSKRVREQRIAQFVIKFNELGIPLTLQDVQQYSNAGTLGRPHVAMALQKRGFVKNLDEAFERFLKRGKPAFVERYRMTAAEAIGHVKRAGGVAILAHPALNRVDTEIPNMVEQGLDGVEVWHSRQSPAQSENYLKLTERLGLLAAGGSDCHGTVRGEPLLGIVKIPYKRVEALRERASQIK
jgi:predicted metal-dependent phosphoesterase TrpH